MRHKKYKTEEERRAAKNERERIRRKNESEAKKAKRRIATNARNRRRYQKETEEQREERRRKKREREKRMKERETSPDKEVARRKRQEYYHKCVKERRKKLPPEEKEKMLRKRQENDKIFQEARQKLLMVDPEHHEEVLNEMKLSKGLKARVLKSFQPEFAKKLEEQREAQKFRNLVYRATMTKEDKQKSNVNRYMRMMAYEAKMSQEELEDYKAKRREYNQNRVLSLTGEKLERHNANVRKALSKYQEKNKERLREYYKAKRLDANPEQRQRILLRDRINQAKRLLKRKLEKAGASSKEIESEVNKLIQRMQAEPLPPPSSYKPRPRKNYEEGDEVLSSDTMFISSKNRPGKETIGRKVTRSRRKNSVQEDPLAINQSHINNETLFPNASNYNHPQTDYQVYPNPSCISQFDNYSSSDCNFDEDSSFSANPPSPAASFSGSCEEYDERDPLAQVSSSGTSDQVKSETDKNPKIKFSPPTYTISNQSTPPSTKTLPMRVEPIAATTTSSLTPPTKKRLILNSIPIKKPVLVTNVLKSTWTCPKCQESHKSAKALAEHYETAHPNLEEQNVNEKGSSKKVKEGSILKFICIKCPKVTSASSFEDKTKLLDHVKQNHPSFFFPCPNCNLLKYNSSSLELHLIICNPKLDL